MIESKIILTAEPHTGKSTLLKKALEECGKPKHGFLTAEVSANGQRTGFEMVTHNNQRFPLATTTVETPFRVSKYFVNIPALEDMIKKMLPIPENKLLYLDEIGQMQLLCEEFQELAQKFLDAPNPFLGTVSAIYPHPFIDLIKKRPDISVVEVTKENRNQLVQHLASRFKY